MCLLVALIDCVLCEFVFCVRFFFLIECFVWCDCVCVYVLFFCVLTCTLVCLFGMFYHVLLFCLCLFVDVIVCVRLWSFI